MKFFKLTKSIDYVAFPAYKELRAIRLSLGTVIQKSRDMLISAGLAILLERLSISKCFLNYLKTNSFPNIIQRFAKYRNADIIVAIVFALILFGVFCIIEKAISCIGGNKNTKKKRDNLEEDFYHVAIPLLIQAKSFIEQIQEQNTKCENVRKMLLLQAEYETKNLLNLLRNMKLIERKKDRTLTNGSSKIISRIGQSTYIELLRGILFILIEMRDLIIKDNLGDEDTRNRIEKHILSGIFTCRELKPLYDPVRESIAKTNEQPANGTQCTG